MSTVPWYFTLTYLPGYPVVLQQYSSILPPSPSLPRQGAHVEHALYCFHRVKEIFRAGVGLNSPSRNDTFLVLRVAEDLGVGAELGRTLSTRHGRLRLASLLKAAAAA